MYMLLTPVDSCSGLPECIITVASDCDGGLTVRRSRNAPNTTAEQAESPTMTNMGMFATLEDSLEVEVL